MSAPPDPAVGRTTTVAAPHVTRSRLMCGIAGVVAAGPGAVAARVLQRLGADLAHRGPDGSGIWMAVDGSVGFVHRRLAVIDPDRRADQPMRSADGRLTLTYNGELYNHREIRTELERAGRSFRTMSDTEVLVEALAEWGTAVLPKLRGMFAFAAHDASTGEVLIARDALGIKPAYIARTATGVLVFASEVRALRPLLSASLDPDAAIDLLLWGSIAAPRTSIMGVRAVPGGHLVRIREGRMVEERWDDPVVWPTGTAASGTVESMVEAVRDSVRAHLVSDVPIAVFLSSGVDSAVVTSIASAHAEVTAVTVRDPDADESEAAAHHANRIGVPHTIVDVAAADAHEVTTAALVALDQPSVDGVNSYVIAKAAAEAGFRVALSGVGGDELFGGYPSFTRLPALSAAHQLLAPLGRTPIRLLGRPTTGWGRAGALGRARWIAAHGGLPHGPYLIARGAFAPTEVAALLDVDLAQVLTVAADRTATIPLGPTSPAYPSAAEATQYLRHQLLRDIDATAMASSVEVRTPLVDRTLLAAAAACPQAIRVAPPAKATLRAAALHDLPGLVRPKRGFSVPMARWLAEGALDLSAVEAGVNDHVLARRVVGDVRAGRAHWSRAWLLQALGHEVTRTRCHG